MMLGPLHISSPGSLTPDSGCGISSPVSGSTSFDSRFGMARPIDDSEMSSRSSGMVCETGLVSVMP